MYKLNKLGIVSMTKFLKVGPYVTNSHIKFHLVLTVCYIMCVVMLSLVELSNIYLYKFFIIYIFFLFRPNEFNMSRPAPKYLIQNVVKTIVLH